VLLVPIISAVVERYRLPLLVVTLPVLAALSVAHGLLPPHPAPTALVTTLQANLGWTLLYGLLIAVPALVLAGPVFARLVAANPARPLAGLSKAARGEAELPGAADPNLMVLAIGAGSLALSHVNDAAFWLFKEYFNVSLADTLGSWTVMETIVSVVGLAGVLVLSWLVSGRIPVP